MTKKMYYKSYPLISLLLLLLVSCNISESDNDLSKESITIDSSELSDTPLSTTLLLTNESSDNTILPIIKIDGISYSSLIFNGTRNLDTPRRVSKPPREAVTRSPRSVREIDPVKDYIIGDTESFVVLTGDVPESAYSSVDLTLELKEDIPDTTYSLNIWVDKNDPENLHYPENAITHISDNFNGIIKDMVSIYGHPWGDRDDSITSYISEDRTDIHIFLLDIASDGGDTIQTDSGVIFGYFDSYDLYMNDSLSEETITTNGKSNQCLNFVIDSYLYFNRTRDSNDNVSDWSEYSFDTIYGVSTLIHEFQHMIHFYQKNLIQDQNITTNEGVFVNEMFSMVAEDILASKYLKILLASGSYGYIPPDLDRFPYFNTGWDVQSSFLWADNSLQSYANSYTLGAYIIRNYDINLLKSFLTSSSSGVDGLLEVLQDYGSPDLTRGDLLHNFGTAVLKSSNDSTVFPYIFNKYVEFYDGEYQLFPFNLHSEYYYGDYTFTPHTLEKYQSLTGEVFNGESNYYIDLGELDNTSLIELVFPEDTDSITYSLIF